MLTDAQLELLHHTLGLKPTQRESYRNHFVAGPGHHDQANLEVIVAAGLMKRGPAPDFCPHGDVVFHATDSGKSYALDNLPFPPKKSRYEEYLSSECCESFAEWLGIEVPELESGNYYYKTRDMWRYTSRRAQGEWAKTKTAAKSSYKEALRKRRMVLA